MSNQDRYKTIKKIEREFHRALGFWDPIGLLQFEDCPRDEYEPEVREIMKSLHSISSASELAFELRWVFAHYFGGDTGDNACYCKIANHMWRYLKRLQKAS